MEREKVSSSVISAVGYDPDVKVMEVEFKSGKVYQYQGVSPGTHASLLDAKSKGQFVVENIVHGRYQFNELDKDKR
jgi:hypothetical protein